MKEARQIAVERIYLFVCLFVCSLVCARPPFTTLEIERAGGRHHSQASGQEQYTLVINKLLGSAFQARSLVLKKTSP
jgi:hypothetical protein